MKLARALAAASTLALAAPALAGHEGIHPTFRTENVWFRCTGPTKVYQVNWVTELSGTASHTTWNTTAPSQSVQQGAGCGGVDWGGTTNSLYDVAFTGTFTGNLRDLTVRLHQLLTGNARQGTTETLRLYAQVDGVALFPPGAQPNHGRTVTVTPVRSSTGASELFEFSITNLGFAKEQRDADGNVVGVETGGLALEDGDGTAEHTLTLYIGLHGTAFGQSPTGHKAGAWAWDTTEVPSGMTFNPAALAAAKVAADLPVFETEE